VRLSQLRNGLAALTLGLLAGLAGHESARAEADFAGKTVTIVVGFGAGGGYDGFARLAADHLGRFLPGNPTVIVENMPGGSGRRALVYTATAAPKDGTVLTIPSSNFAVDALRGEDAGVVDPAAFGMIGRLAESRELQLTWKTSPTKTFADAQQRETPMASDGPTGNGSTVLRVLNTYFGARFKLIEGYSGTAEMALAMERGEVEGMVASVQTVTVGRPQWIADGQVHVLWQQAADRSAAFPDTPALVEFARNDEERALLDLLVGQGQIGKSLAAPPGIPDDMLAAFRAAYAEMIVDPDFLADARKRNLEILPGTPADLEAVIGRTLASDPAAVEKLVAVLKAAAN
jgi:tripartite-type tricarboxylate transporter receptor subunit TctC